MKIKKTITDKVIAANQINGKRGNGPNNPSNGDQNAWKHGLTAKHLVFRNEAAEQEFDVLAADLMTECQPVGRTEIELVIERAVCFWKSAEAHGLEMQELAHRRKAGAAILRTLVENYDDEQLPLFTQGDGSGSAVQFGWDCQELVVRTGTGNSEQEHEDEEKSGERKGKSGHVQIEARLNTSLDTIMRYHAAVKRDLYRAIAELRSLRRERREESGAGKKDDKSIIADRRD